MTSFFRIFFRNILTTCWFFTKILIIIALYLGLPYYIFTKGYDVGGLIVALVEVALTLNVYFSLEEFRG